MADPGRRQTSTLRRTDFLAAVKRSPCTWLLICSIVTCFLLLRWPAATWCHTLTREVLPDPIISNIITLAYRTWNTPPKFCVTGRSDQVQLQPRYASYDKLRYRTSGEAGGHDFEAKASPKVCFLWSLWFCTTEVQDGVVSHPYSYRELVPRLR